MTTQEMTPQELITYINTHTGGLFKCFYFKDSYDFASSGVSDKLINLIYIRPLVSGPSKYLVKKEGYGILSIKAKYRLVVQTKKTLKNIDNTMLNILDTVGMLTLTSYTDDTDGVYKAEYGDNEVIRTFNLHSFDFELEQELAHDCKICECITEG